MTAKNSIEFAWTEMVPKRGLISMATMRRRLTKHYSHEGFDKDELSRIIDTKIDAMIVEGRTLRLSGIDYQYIPSTGGASDNVFS